MLRQGDDGTSLAELGVSMMVGGVVLAALSAAVLGLNRSAGVVNTSTRSTGDLRVASDGLNRLLRVAQSPSTGVSAVAAATASSVTFYASLDRTGGTSTTAVVPTKVQISYDGTCVKRALIPGPAYTTTASTTCLLRTAVAPAFTYYASPSPSATALTTPGTGLTSAVLPTVQSIETTLTAARTATEKAPEASRLVDRVVLANVVNAS